MSAPNLSQQAAASPNASVWVSASAGTGKTQVLTTRVLRLLLAGTPPGRILCLTYTRAAAAEMANRIQKRLGAWAAASEGELACQLKDILGTSPDEALCIRARALFGQVLDLPGGMRIQTIHAFCESLLARFPLEAGVSPGFALMDERTRADLIHEAREALTSTAWQSARAGDDTQLADDITLMAGVINEVQFTDFLMEVATHRGRLLDLMGERDLNGIETALCDALKVNMATENEGLRTIIAPDRERTDHLRALVSALEEGGKTDKESAKRIADFLDAAEEARQELLHDYRKVFLTNENKIRDRTPVKKVQEKYPKVRDIYVCEGERLLSFEAAQRNFRLATHSAAALRVAGRFLDVYSGLKRRRHLLDYDDLILAVRQLFSRPGIAPWVLFKLDGGLDHILVDEAQDTNPDQWAIIEAITDEFFSGVGQHETQPTLFVVGDPKQSIYSFQRADPRVFHEKGGTFREKVQQGGGSFRVVPLDLSYRSAPAIIQGVNRIFRREEARQGLAFDDTTLDHQSNRHDDAGRIELWPPISTSDTSTSDTGPDGSPQSAAGDLPPWRLPVEQREHNDAAFRLADRIACRIKTWCKTGERLDARNRPMEYGDIMVLVRRRDTFFDQLVRRLKSHGVPVAGTDRMRLKEQLAVMDLMALGRFALFPGDDLTLATVLKGPFLGISEEDLFTLAKAREKMSSPGNASPAEPGKDSPKESSRQSLWQSLGTLARDGKNRSLADAHAFLEGVLRRAGFVPPFEFFAALLAAHRPKLRQRLGPEMDEPVDEFLNLALAYEGTGPASLEGFLHWVAAGAVEEKRDLEERRGEVRVMTVHGAKGLEAPVVILPDTCRLPPQNGRHEDALLWSAAGEGTPPLVFWPGRKDNDDDRYCKTARDTRLRREMEEYHRLLYVALTRAADRLYVCGWTGQRGRDPGCWYDLIKDGLDGLLTAVTDEEGEEVYRYDAPQKREIPPPPAILPRVQPRSLPAWATTAADESAPPALPVRPSLVETGADRPSPVSAVAEGRFHRGRLIHRLLETLPDLDAAARDEACSRFLAQPRHGLEPQQQAEMALTVQTLLAAPALAPLFGPGSRAEVAITGRLGPGDGAEIIGQVDRLVVREDEVLIVDYKTNRVVPAGLDEVPAEYVTQMALYRAVLEKIYEGKTIRCLLLWTDGPSLMTLPDPLLEAALTRVHGARVHGALA